MPDSNIIMYTTEDGLTKIETTFENHHRGRFLRIIEEIKVLLGKSATVGIMQIKSDSRLSDKRSIEIVYDRLKKQCENGKIEDMDAICHGEILKIGIICNSNFWC